jgi:hypothetical protein
MNRGDLTAKWIRLCGHCGFRRHISGLPADCRNCGRREWTRDRTSVTLPEARE